MGLSLVLSGCGPSKTDIKAAEDKKTQEAFDTAKNAYTALNEASDFVVGVMDSVYGAWYFGIYKADDSTTTNVISNLSKETHLSTSELSAAVKSLTESIGVSEYLWEFSMTDDWQYCLYTVNEAYVLNGVIGEIQQKIDTANAALRTMTNEFDDYKHYPTLKDYYAKVTSYFEFAQNPTGSFQQLKDTINSYETDMRTLKSDLSFVFE